MFFANFAKTVILYSIL